jgi:hypothetical protein
MSPPFEDNNLTPQGPHVDTPNQRQVLKLRKKDPLPTNPNPQKTSLNHDPYEGPTTKLRPTGSRDELKTKDGEGVPLCESRTAKESHTRGESRPSRRLFYQRRAEDGEGVSRTEEVKTVNYGTLFQ